jgi:hypothetical protein
MISSVISHHGMPNTCSRFSLKIHGIVDSDGEKNFLTQLHRGEMTIIPWPVFNSLEFYEEFDNIRECIESQPPTHSRGGVFLRSLKTLMAKIKVCLLLTSQIRD